MIFYECICFYLTVSESDIIKLFNQSNRCWLFTQSMLTNFTQIAHVACNNLCWAMQHRSSKHSCYWWHFHWFFNIHIYWYFLRDWIETHEQLRTIACKHRVSFQLAAKFDLARIFFEHGTPYTREPFSVIWPVSYQLHQRAFPLIRISRETYKYRLNIFVAKTTFPSQRHKYWPHRTDYYQSHKFQNAQISFCRLYANHV